MLAFLFNIVFSFCVLSPLYMCYFNAVHVSVAAQLKSDSEFDGQIELKKYFKSLGKKCDI